MSYLTRDFDSEFVDVWETIPIQLTDTTKEWVGDVGDELAGWRSVITLQACITRFGVVPCMDVVFEVRGLLN